jgi:hypothetical protein
MVSWTAQQRSTTRADLIAFFDQIADQPHEVARIIVFDNAAIHKGDVMDKNGASGQSAGCACTIFRPTVLNSTVSKSCGNTPSTTGAVSINGAALLEEIQSLMKGFGSKFMINFA